MGWLCGVSLPATIRPLKDDEVSELVQPGLSGSAERVRIRAFILYRLVGCAQEPGGRSAGARRVAAGSWFSGCSRANAAVTTLVQGMRAGRRRPVLVEAVRRKVCQGGVFGGADAVLAAAVVPMSRPQLGRPSVANAVCG